MPRELTDWTTEIGLRIETRASVLLGSPVGRDPTAIEACLRENFKAHDSLFNLLGHDQFPLQAAFLLGRVSGGPKINHNLRSVPPRFMSKFAHDVDERIRGLLSRRLFLEQGFTGAATPKCPSPSVCQA